MNFRRTAASFFQNVADYLDPVAAWDRTPGRQWQAENRRRAEGNFTGRELTPEEEYQKYCVDYFRRSHNRFQAGLEKIKAAQKAGLI